MYKKKCKDHKGVEFDSVTAMCLKYGITLETYYRRLRKGFTTEQILTGDGIARSNFKGIHEFVDHENVKHKTLIDMCRAWEVPVVIYLYRRDKGYSLEQSLTGRGIEPEGIGAGCCIDPNDKIHRSVDAMCAEWGVNASTFRKRVMMGWFLSEALTGVRREVNLVYDHENTPYNSVREMCHKWDIPESTFKARMASGSWTLKQALTCKNAIKTEMVDHEGQAFESLSAMCRKWRLSPTTYKTRIDRGWTVKEALTGERDNKEIIRDHEGNEFRSVRAMCKYHNVGRSTYLARIDRGMSIKEALTGKCDTEK